MQSGLNAGNFRVNARQENGLANTNIECRRQATYWDAEPSFVWVKIQRVSTLARIRVCASLTLKHIALVKVFLEKPHLVSCLDSPCPYILFQICPVQAQIEGLISLYVNYFIPISILFVQLAIVVRQNATWIFASLHWLCGIQMICVVSISIGERTNWEDSDTDVMCILSL